MDIWTIKLRPYAKSVDFEEVVRRSARSVKAETFAKREER